MQNNKTITKHEYNNVTSQHVT